MWGQIRHWRQTGFSIHGGMCASHYVNNTVFRKLRQQWELKNSKHSLLHMSMSIYSSCATVSSPFLTLADFWPFPLSKKAVGKLLVHPSDNDKMMTGLWPWLHGLQEGWLQAKGIKENKKMEQKMERSKNYCYLLLVNFSANVMRAEVGWIKST